MGEFTTHTLLDLTDSIADNRGRTCPTAESGTPLIATNCLKVGHKYPVYENVRYVDRETLSSWFRAHPEPGDVLFVTKGSPGRVAVVPDPVDFCIAQDMVALRARRGVVEPGYLYYRLLCADVRDGIEGLHVGTMIPHFKKGDFDKLEITVHSDLKKQKAIAEVLGALDDKIAANDEVIVRSQELAALTWSRATRAQESELVPLSRLARFVNGRAYTKGATGTGRVVIRIAELNSGIGGSTVYNDIEVPDDNVARPGDLLFAWSGSLTVARWHRPEAIINQHIFKVVPVDGRPQWLVEHALRDKLAEFQAVAADKATTMGHIQRRHLDEPVSIPGHAEARLIGPQMEALTDQVASFESENLVLAHTRDQLLPLLMSGKVTVKEAEDEIGGLV
ncbi:restriction endonuclease subunit S [Gordonia bronchialis]|uniref:restriction endonuclease subunit S n=1 Tax=Gordonia bronchialis TaxID=2054 RepID=UPI001CBB6CCB|nr:restriction endonuclease subunit S [Gordonia bronchialis]UAK38202.1 restriction endonuclease subunit S [Gordonia bronchialis]